MSVRNIFADESHDIYTVRTHADGPDGNSPSASTAPGVKAIWRPLRR